jgi:adenine phosphoribosyltransferase
MFNDVEITEACAKALLAKAPDFDVMITAESKGIPLAYEMSRQSGKPYIVARKGVKLYMRDAIMVHVKSITTSGVQTLCLGRDEKELMEGKRILIVDDVISTGESLNALEQLVNEVGGNIVGKFAVLAEGDGDGHRRAHADEVTKRKEHDDEGHGKVDGRERILANEVAHEHAVHDVVDGRHQHAHGTRQGGREEELWDGGGAKQLLGVANVRHDALLAEVNGIA